MSDVSQGPGWWQASDGKWYPPEQAAPAAPTGPPPGYAPPTGPPPGYAPPGTPPGYGPPAGYGAPGASPYGAPAYGQPGAPVEDLKGARAGARAIDVLLVIVVGFVISLPFGVATYGAGNDDDVSTGAILLVGVLVNLLSIAYEVFMVSSKGGTVGKLALGLKIVKNDGSDLDLADAAKRHSPTIIPRLVGIIPVIGLLGSLGLLVVFVINIVMLLSKGSSLYDQVGDTRVIRSR